ncbi:hypothetical protein HDU93_003183, partial [Gonapodya sp. JEL0774]
MQYYSPSGPALTLPPNGPNDSNFGFPGGVGQPSRQQQQQQLQNQNQQQGGGAPLGLAMGGAQGLNGGGAGGIAGISGISGLSGV